ncbi:uncharacterized protein G2W53_044643 [Senna tora]|uniref:Uncharacterized protein n=1 Tax=Senna tora TaxID=362788 RepID=A0A834SCX7_9FABA|nr:uncharacterized protein G2W53_044643 [Senna tora]
MGAAYGERVHGRFIAASHMQSEIEEGRSIKRNREEQKTFSRGKPRGELRFLLEKGPRTTSRVKQRLIRAEPRGKRGRRGQSLSFSRSRQARKEAGNFTSEASLKEFRCITHKLYRWNCAFISHSA